jgi:dTDP-4-dehydrorhamnose 3,5-epimerase
VPKWPEFASGAVASSLPFRRLRSSIEAGLSHRVRSMKLAALDLLGLMSAHGFLALEVDCEAFYMMSEVLVREPAAGRRRSNRAFAIEWPFAPAIISARDADRPDFTS